MVVNLQIIMPVNLCFHLSLQDQLFYLSLLAEYLSAPTIEKAGKTIPMEQVVKKLDVDTIKRYISSKGNIFNLFSPQIPCILPQVQISPFLR